MNGRAGRYDPPMPEAEPYLHVEVEQRGDVAVVRAAGEVDAATAPQLAGALEGDAARSDVELDLSGVTFIDSSGIRVVARVHAAVSEAGRSFTITAAGEPVRKIFTMTGLDALLADG